VQTGGSLSDSKDLTNVAYALLSDSPVIIKSISNKYSAKWVFVARNDARGVDGMAILLGDTLSKYSPETGATNFPPIKLS
jgi:hypothetical protein